MRLPYGVVLPIAYLAEGFAKLSGRSGRITLEGVRMSRKRMFFSSAKASRELGYHCRPPVQAFEDAIRWFRDNGSLMNDACAYTMHMISQERLRRIPTR